MSPIIVLALDGADYELARKWNCDNLLLDNSKQIETFAYSRDEPYTPEVWTAVATGRHPKEFENIEMEWENPLFRAGSKATQHLPMSARQKLGDLVGGKSDGMDLSIVDSTHVFDMGAVKGWPGITPAENLVETWRLYTKMQEGRLHRKEHHGVVFSNFYEELGWARGCDVAGLPIAGVHLHFLDTMGHTYARSPLDLVEFYRRADEAVGELREHVNQLVILSDHGMQTTAVDGDENPGMHSWRAMISGQNVEIPLPDSVFDVREWLEGQLGDHKSDLMHSDTTGEQLEALGYL